MAVQRIFAPFDGHIIGQRFNTQTWSGSVPD
jgi:hypothetical protein